MIYINNYEHGQTIMKSINSAFTEVTMQVISRAEDGELYGGVVFENYTGPGGSILIHVGSFVQNWINRDMLYATFDYPFVQLDCKQIFGQVAAKNTHSLEFNRKLGFEEVIRLEGVFPDDDMILMRVRRDQCRFLGIKPRTIRSNKVTTNG